MNKIFTYAFTKKLFLLGLITLFSIARVFAQAPTVSSFSPESGAVGTIVTITGAGFGPIASNNIVFFGAAKATVTAASATSLTVTVPVGATYQPISVLNGNNALIGYSSKPFITTFTPNKGAITGSDFNPLVKITFGGWCSAVVLADVDGDGKPDLVATDTFNGTVSVFQNLSVSGAITASSFGPKITFAVSGGAGTLTVGDLDGDGKPDIAITNPNTNTVSIFRNTSTVGSINSGAFAPAVTFATGTSPGSIAISDLDGDGKPDLAISCYLGNSISFLKNTSAKGTINFNSFAAHVDLPAQGPGYIAISDLDGDGKPDLAIANPMDSTISIWRNIATAGVLNITSFAAPVKFGRGARPGFIAIGDLDGDGKPDLAVSSTQDHAVSVFRNTSVMGGISSGSFATGVSFATSFDANNLAISDLDGDGKPDLVLTDMDASQTFVLRNTSIPGTITASSFATKTNLYSGSWSYGIAVGDLDGDGIPDLAITNYNGDGSANSISILHNNPFFPPSIQATDVTFTNTTTNSTTASWTNGNGLSRAVFVAQTAIGNPAPENGSTYTANSVWGSGIQIESGGWYCVYKGIGTSVNITGLSSGSTYRVMAVEYNGTAGSENYLAAGSTGNPANLTTLGGGQISIDSIHMVTSSPTNANTVQFTTTFAAPVTGLTAANFALATTGSISGAAITTINGSGSTYTITVSTGTGNGTIGLNLVNAGGLTPGIITQLPFTGPSYIVDHTVHAAPVITSFSPATGPVGSSVTITGTGFSASPNGNIVFFGATQGKVTSASATSLTVIVPAGATYQPISVLNGTTALVGYSNGPFVNTFVPAKGDITAADFLPPVIFKSGIGPTDVAVGDLDGDGKPDIVVTNYQDNTVSVLRNMSTIGSITTNSFAPKVDFATGTNPTGVTVADLDGDGKPDIIVANSTDKTISVLRNISSAGAITATSFAPKVNFATDATPLEIKVGDMDGDGKADILARTFYQTDPVTLPGRISIFRNTSTIGSITTNSFAAPLDLNYGVKGNSTGNMVIGDLDGDGKPDIAVSAEESLSVVLFRNTSTIGTIDANSFAAPFYMPAGFLPSGLKIGDMDGDGKLDLICYTYGGLSVFRNISVRGTLNASSFSSLVTYPISIGGQIAIGDVDGDGKPDIVAGSIYNPGGFLSIYRNTSVIGSINSSSLAPEVVINSGNGTVGIFLADIDGDGRADLITRINSNINSSQGNEIAILRNSPFFPPTVQATNITFTNTGTNSTTASWTPGNGSARAVFVALGSTGSAVPLNRTDYTANTVFSSGTEIGSTAWYCVYNGSGNTVSITGLSSGATYRVMVVEYNGDPGGENYLTTTATGNPANVTTIAGGLIAIDSINRVTAALTNVASVQYKAIFLTSITGLTAGDFALSTTGNISGASITSVTGSGSNYTITVNTGTGDGTIGLNLAGATGVLPGIITPLPFVGQTYTLDRTPPSITISNPSDSLILSGTSKKVTYKVTYADSNFNSSALSASNISLNSTGSAAGTISVSGTDTSYTVAISNITGSGSMGISIAGGTATDLAGNTAPPAGPSYKFLIAPTLSDLTVSNGTLAPVFADSVVNYAATVTNTTSSAIVIPTLTDPNATVTVNGGSPSTPVNLAIGSNTIIVTVTTLDGKLTTTYTVRVFRAGLPPDIAYGTGNIVINNSRAFSVTPLNKGGAIPQTHYGQVTTFAGSPSEANGYTNDTGTLALFNNTQQSVMDGSGNLYVTDVGNNAVRMITPLGVVTTFAGNGTVPADFIDGKGTAARFNYPDGIAIDITGNLYVSDYSNNAIRKITPAGVVTTIYKSTTTFGPGGLCIDASGNLIVAAQDASQIIRITPAGIASIIAGSTTGYANGAATSAQFDTPGDVKVDTAGNIYVADYNNNAIRKITPAGQVTTIAGSIVAGNTGGFADETGTDAIFNHPPGLFLAPGGIMYVADMLNNDIRRIMPDSTVSLVAGSASQASGDSDGIGTAAQFYTPAYIYIDDAGTAYVSEIFGNRVRKLVLTGYTLKGTLPAGLAFDPTTGTISGTPFVPFTATTDTVTAFNAFGYSTTIFHITYQPPSTIATLSNLVPGSGVLNPIFASATTNYTVDVPNSTASITLTPTATDSTATIKVNGITVASGAASGSIPLAVGSNTITTVVTAQDSVSTDTYTVIVNRAALSTVATLNNLTISSGTLTPSFATGTVNYLASVANNVTSVTVTPTTSDANATIKVNGTLVSSGNASAPIPLAVGPNTITTVVTAQDGTTIDTYTIVVTRALSSDATLINLTVSQGTLTPAFNSGTFVYTDNVPNSTTSITVTPATSDANATITVNGTAVISGIASGAIPLAIGPNTITTVVTAQDGTTTDKYTVIVTRAADANATLTDLTVSQGTLTPAFNSGTLAYTDNVPNSTTSVTVTPTISDNTATIKVNGATVASGTTSASIPLNVGPNTITTVVTAQDGMTTQTYTVIVTRAASADAGLVNLTVSEGTLSPAFNGEITAYTDTVSNLISSLTVTATTSDQTATITVNGTAMANNSPSGAIPLVAGANTITVIITAQDGTTTNTYTITVYRGESMGSIDATNVLTPNGDGKNDYWLIKDINLYPQNNVTVYDKAGRVVYGKRGYNNDWDGTLNGSPLAEGTYYFVVDLGPNLRKFKGFVSILRN